MAPKKGKVVRFTNVPQGLKPFYNDGIGFILQVSTKEIYQNNEIEEPLGTLTILVGEDYKDILVNIKRFKRKKSSKRLATNVVSN